MCQVLSSNLLTSRAFTLLDVLNSLALNDSRPRRTRGSGQFHSQYFYLCKTYLIPVNRMSEIKLPYAIIEYKEPIVYLRLIKAFMWGPKEIIEYTEAVDKLREGKPHLLFTDARVGADLSPEAREIAADNNIIVANAVLVKWLAQRLITNVFMQVNKPAFPIQIFNEEDKATKWLMDQWNKREIK